MSTAAVEASIVPPILACQPCRHGTGHRMGAQLEASSAGGRRRRPASARPTPLVAESELVVPLSRVPSIRQCIVKSNPTNRRV
jgi:hypothetical protein